MDVPGLFEFADGCVDLMKAILERTGTQALLSKLATAIDSMGAPEPRVAAMLDTLLRNLAR